MTACAEGMQQKGGTAGINAMHSSLYGLLENLLTSVAVTDMAGKQAWVLLQVRTLRADLKREQQGRGGTASPATQFGPSVSPVPVCASVEPPRFSQ